MPNVGYDLKGEPQGTNTTMSKRKGKRIVLDASPELGDVLSRTAQSLDTTQVATVRMAVSVLAQVADELAAGNKLVLRDKKGHEREHWLPTLRRHEKAAGG
jgi:hypothetical protein